MQFIQALQLRVNDTLLNGAPANHPFLSTLVSQLTQERSKGRKQREYQLEPLTLDSVAALYRLWSEGDKLPRLLPAPKDARATVEPTGDVVALVTRAAPATDVTVCPKCRKGNAMKLYGARYWCYRCNTGGSAADWIVATEGISRSDAVARVAAVAPMAQLDLSSRFDARVPRVSLAPSVAVDSVETHATIGSTRHLSLEARQWLQESRKIPVDHLPDSVTRVSSDTQDTSAKLRGALASGDAIGSLMRDCNGTVQNVQVRFYRDGQIKSHGKRLLQRGGKGSVCSAEGDPYLFGDVIQQGSRCVIVCEGDMDTLAAQVTLPRGDASVVVGAYAENAMQDVAQRLRRVNCIPESVCVLGHHDVKPVPVAQPAQVGLFAAPRNVGASAALKLKAALAAETRTFQLPQVEPSKQGVTLGILATIDTVSLEFLRAKFGMCDIRRIRFMASGVTRDSIVALAKQMRVDAIESTRDECITGASCLVTLADHGDSIEPFVTQWAQIPVSHLGYSWRVWQRYGVPGVPCRVVEWQVLLRSIAATVPSDVIASAGSVDTSVSWDYNDLIVKFGASVASVVARHLGVV